MSSKVYKGMAARSGAIRKCSLPLCHQPQTEGFCDRHKSSFSRLMVTTNVGAFLAGVVIGVFIAALLAH